MVKSNESWRGEYCSPKGPRGSVGKLCSSSFRIWTQKYVQNRLNLIPRAFFYVILKKTAPFFGFGRVLNMRASCAVGSRSTRTEIRERICRERFDQFRSTRREMIQRLSFKLVLRGLYGAKFLVRDLIRKAGRNFGRIGGIFGRTGRIFGRTGGIFGSWRLTTLGLSCAKTPKRT